MTDTESWSPATDDDADIANRALCEVSGWLGFRNVVDYLEALMTEKRDIFKRAHMTRDTRRAGR